MRDKAACLRPEGSEADSRWGNKSSQARYVLQKALVRKRGKPSSLLHSLPPAAATPTRATAVHPSSITIKTLGPRSDLVGLLVEGEILLPETLLKIEGLLLQLVDGLLVRIGLRIQVLELLVLLEQLIADAFGLLPLLLAKLIEFLGLLGAQLTRLITIPAAVAGAISWTHHVAAVAGTITRTHHVASITITHVPVPAVTRVVGQGKPAEADTERHNQSYKNYLFHT